MKTIKIILSIIFCADLLGTIAGCFALSRSAYNQEYWLYLVAVGQFFAVIGLFSLFHSISSAREREEDTDSKAAAEHWLGTIVFLLAGIGMTAGGILWKYGGPDKIQFVKNHAPTTIIIVTMGIAIILLLFFFRFLAKRKRCSLGINAVCTSVFSGRFYQNPQMSDGNGNQKTWKLYYSFDYRGQNYTVSNNFHSTIGLQDGKTYRIHINPENPNEFYDRVAMILSLFLGFISTAYILITIYMLLHR